ncbi:MAG: nitroreductase/quinone reductase family protein [Nocardioidaceae bacterium]
MCELRFTGRRSGRQVVLPVMYAQRTDTIVVLVGGPEQKRWWRNFAEPHPVRIWLRGATRTGTGRVVAVGSAGRAEAADIYAARFPKLPVEDDPLVVIALDSAG